jgi:hypothetical protein
MRWRTLAPLVAATGCNWLYGLDQTILVDAQYVEVLPPGPRTTLVWGIATTDGAGSPDPILEYKPIGSEAVRPQLPTILIGDDTALMPATYDLADGSFEIPYALRESPHRILYTLPGESVPHEVQWAVTGAKLVVPRATRADAPAPPAGSGYAITPAGLAGQVVAPALYTSGAFTYSNDGNDFSQTNGTITFPYAQDASPVTAPLGAPQAARGDWVLLTEWASNGTTQSYVDFYGKTQVDLVANMMSVPATEPTWINTKRSLTTLKCTTMPVDCLPSPNQASTDGRLNQLELGSTQSKRMMYGVSPSTDLPGFLPGVAPAFIERPLMLPFVDANAIDASISVADPSADLGLERVIMARISLSRTVGGAVLTSSLQTITNQFTTNSVQFSAPLITTARLGTVELSTPGTNDGIPMPASSGLQKLQFTTEGGSSADDFVVTLYELSGSALAPVRVFHVVGNEVKVDSTLLVPGRQYVFGIAARNGIPGARQGQYGTAKYPFTVATTFLRTFVVQ